MPIPDTLDRSVWELSMERGPWKRSKLYRVGLAVQAVRGLDSPETALDAIWDRADALGGAHASGPTMREVLEVQNIDVEAVARRLQSLDHELALELHAEQAAQTAAAYERDRPLRAAARRRRASESRRAPIGGVK